MSGHSNGPWRVDPSSNCDVQTANGEWEIATTHQNALTGGRVEGANAQANARLIAAAPDMADEIHKQIAWLKHIRSELVRCVSFSVVIGLDQSIKAFEAVVAKAEGKS
jgi:hypothetical protein